MQRVASVLLLLSLFTAGNLKFCAPVAAEVSIIINNTDAAKVGFNDPTAVTPVGGNPGKTLGAQRLNILRFAADLWGSVLDSAVSIVVQSTFAALPCDATSAVLGAAGPIRAFANFPATSGPVHSQIWYPSVLANKFAGVDLTPGPPDPGLLQPPYADDMVAFFNGALDGNPNCLPGNWYYGYDNNPPSGDIALLNVVMHEFAHGLGLSAFINPTTGEAPLGLPDIYSTYTLDTTTGKHWHEMSSGERRASAGNSGHVVWSGPAVIKAAPTVLAQQPEVAIVTPKALAATVNATPTAFGPGLTAKGITAPLIVADDRSGTRSDACTPLKNRVEGRIVLITRGTCPVTWKVAHAEAAGASAILLVNATSDLPTRQDDSDPPVTIPTLTISDTVGVTLSIALKHPPVVVTLRANPRRLLGADTQGRVYLYTPRTAEPGSAISHWDPRVTPNLLMEPVLNADLDAGSDTDLTYFQLQDIGWKAPESSDSSSQKEPPTVEK
ncbi:MAG: peptidase [Deltaproteobacteria bacterium]|nr:peptidase [Deltaproteobacteria bacterium]